MQEFGSATACFPTLFRRELVSLACSNSKSAVFGEIKVTVHIPLATTVVPPTDMQDETNDAKDIAKERNRQDQEFLRLHDDLPSSPLSFSQLSAAPAVAAVPDSVSGCLGGLKLVSSQMMKRFFSHQASSVPAQQLRLNGK
ncbi:hypothetical protein DTO212C5_4380 [Paecilomyces variotii]|nr:hypothetical protein DTO212C5_4380 [Paecilomyces variotii]